MPTGSRHAVYCMHAHIHRHADSTRDDLQRAERPRDIQEFLIAFYPDIRFESLYGERTTGAEKYADNYTESSEITLGGRKI